MTFILGFFHWQTCNIYIVCNLYYSVTVVWNIIYCRVKCVYICRNPAWYLYQWLLKLHGLILLNHTMHLARISIAVVLTVEQVYKGSLSCEFQASISMHVRSQVIEELYTEIAHTVGDHIIIGAWVSQHKTAVSHVHLPFAPTVLLMVQAIAHKFRAMNNHYNSN